MNKKVTIASLLPEGRENAISPQKLCLLAGVSNTRVLRAKIAQERKEGALILSHYKGGYYVSNDIEEIRTFARTLENRAKNTLVALKSARKYLKRLEGQMKLDL